MVMDSDKHASFFHGSNARQENAPRRLFIIIVAASLLMGLVGGFFGARLQMDQKSGGSVSPRSITTVQVEENSTIIDVVKKAAPAVVSIVISQDLNKLPGYGFGSSGDPFADFFNQNDQNAAPNIQQVGAGTGFLISADGLVMTNRHVVSEADANYTVVMTDGKTYEAKVLSRDPVNDLAILKIEIQDAPTLSFATNQVQLGQRVIAIGNSLGEYENTVTTGVVSGIGRSITAGGEGGAEQLEGVIQTDAAINPGNSGGPLLDITGHVVGINTAIDRQGQSVGFAIPANDAVKAVTSFEKFGRIVRPLLGVRYVIITPSLADRNRLPKNYGALIIKGLSRGDVAVLPGSPAERAGIVENDIILELNGQKIDQDNSLIKALKDVSVGDEVTLKIYRAGEEKTVRVVLTENKQ